MSYPPTRYIGETGEINATFRPADTHPDFISTPVATTGPTIAPGHRLSLPRDHQEHRR